MGYDWGKASEGGQAEQIPAGQHQLKIVKVVFGKKDGTKFASSNGDPQIMVVFADNQDREAAQMVTLSEKAGWVLASILKAAGADMAKMTERGITPAKFAEEKFAEAQLIGRVLTAHVSWETADNGKEYASIKPLRARAEVPDEIPI